ncbi:hypothetical protein L596_013183 [Steinernema carpocapsae]|uniref:peptidylprolyl isomerase n=1 Tax=Steinernema carpocapsae TaxID=34508 RepID=A0A4U5NZK1_STECR|nr:hypothetical protein L596_013183 [Steinernema carpocapsae]
MGAALGVPEYIIHPRNERNELIPYSDMDPQVFLDLATADGDDLGRVVLKLSAKTHPLLTENFRLLCRGEKTCAMGSSLHYRKTPLHAICWREGVVVGGDVFNKNGSGGHAANDVSFTAREESLPKEVGSLCMFNQSSKSVRFDSQFFIIVDDCGPLQDGVAFGKVTEGLEVLEEIMRFGSNSGIPKKKIVIADCGQV